MRKISKSQLQQREIITAELRKFYIELQEDVENINKLIIKINKNQDLFNKNVDLANSFIQEINQLQQKYYDDRSEQWQESENGENYQEWINEWESVAFDEIEIDLSGDEVELTEGDDYADQFYELSENP